MSARAQASALVLLAALALPATAGAKGSAGLYAPFPGKVREGRIRTFFKAASVRTSPAALARGQFVTSHAATGPALRAVPAGPASRGARPASGVSGALEGGALALVVAAVGGAAAVRWRPMRRSALPSGPTS